MFNPGRTKKKKKILYHDKYNDLYTHPCNTRILFRVLIRVDKILLFSLLLFVQLFFHQKKKKNKGSNYTLTSETYQPTSKRLILRPSSRPNLLLLNFKKRKKKSTQFDKIVKKITRRCRTYHSSTTTSEKKIYSRRVKNSTHRTTHWTRLSTIFFRMNPFDEGRGEGEGLLVLISGAYPHAECGDLQYALDGEHPREAHVHVLQRVLVRVALPMELQCMTLTNTRAERDGQKRAFVKQAYQFPACNSRFPPSPLFSASAL